MRETKKVVYLYQDAQRSISSDPGNLLRWLILFLGNPGNRNLWKIISNCTVSILPSKMKFSSESYSSRVQTIRIQSAQSQSLVHQLNQSPLGPHPDCTSSQIRQFTIQRSRIDFAAAWSWFSTNLVLRASIELENTGNRNGTHPNPKNRPLLSLIP